MTEHVLRDAVVLDDLDLEPNLTLATALAL